MTDVFYRDLSQPVSLDLPRTPIRDERPGIAKRVQPEAAEQAYLRPFGNPRLNARLGLAVPDGHWVGKWVLELPPDLAPRFVLRWRDRVLVQGLGGWWLVDAAKGRALSPPFAQPRQSDVTLDPVRGGFYFMHAHGYVASHDRDGGLRSLCPGVFSDGFVRLLVAREDDGFRVVSVNLGPPRGTMYPLWAAERILIGDESRVDEDRVLPGRHEGGLLMQRTAALVPPALDGHTLIAAVPDRLYAIDGQLQVGGALTGDFEPLRLSLDEEGRVYVIVRTGEVSALWVVTREGGRLVNAPLPAEMETVDVPPVVGFDHRVYVIAGPRIQAIGPDGTTAWEHTDTNPIAGAVVTADDKLLVSAGSQVAAFDGRGTRTVLFQANEETLRTPPVLSDANEMLVASDRHLYCLGVGGGVPTESGDQ